MTATRKVETMTINRCLGCGRSVLRTQTEDGHVPGCPVKAHRDAYNAGLRDRLDRAKARRGVL